MVLGCPAKSLLNLVKFSCNRQAKRINPILDHAFVHSIHADRRCVFWNARMLWV